MKDHIKMSIEIINLFNNRIVQVVGGLLTLYSVFLILLSIYWITTGIMPVLYRLGFSLSKRKIAIYGKTEFSSLRDILVDSGLFKDKNIVQIHDNDIKKAEDITLFMIYWPEFHNKLDDILSIKKDATPLIVYAPQEIMKIDLSDIKKMNAHRNVIIVNFRGRLINDILISLITTGFKR